MEQRISILKERDEFGMLIINIKKFILEKINHLNKIPNPSYNFSYFSQDESALDLIDRMLTFNPNSRIDAT